jgi:hypothetical protein
MEAVSPPATAFPRNTHATVAMLRMIEGVETPSATHLHQVLGGISRAHLNNKKALVKPMKKQVFNILRQEVPIDQESFVRFIAVVIWKTLTPGSFGLGELAFEEHVEKVIETKLEKSIQGYIALHDVVLNVGAVHRIMNGQEIFDPTKKKDLEKIWLKRDPAVHDSYIRTAVNLIGEAAGRGIFKELKRHDPSRLEASKKPIIERAVEHGLGALATFDAGAFRSGGTPAMLRALSSHA